MTEALSLGELWLIYGVVSRFAAPELPDLSPSGYCPLQPNSKHWFTASFGFFVLVFCYQDKNKDTMSGYGLIIKLTAYRR